MKAKLDTLKERLNVKVFELKEKDDKIIKLTREAEVAEVKHLVRVADLIGSYRCAKFDLIDAQKKIDELKDSVKKENTEPIKTELRLAEPIKTELCLDTNCVNEAENTQGVDKKTNSSILQSVKETMRRKFYCSCNKLYRAFSVFRGRNTVVPI